MRLKIFYIVLLLFLTILAESKRGSRGRSRGSSSGSSSFWNRKNGKNPSPPQKPVDTPSKSANPPATQPKTAPKPSAPKEPEIKKENVNLQQNAPPNSGRPIGWDVNNNKDGFSAQKQNVNPSYASGAYPQSGSYPGGYGHNPAGYGHNPGAYPGSYGHNPGAYPGSYGQNPGSYGHNPGGYGQNPGAYPGAYGHNPGAYSGYPGYNGYNPQNPGSNMGHYPNSMGGYPNMGGYGNYPHQTSGSFFGGNKYGGYGGLGNYGSYYGMKKSSGFFGKHAFRNVLAGFGIWYLVSGLISTPFKVYSYYNMPREQRQEITLPANVLTLCNENATSICVPGTTAICTQDNRILCVTSMTSTQPCKDNNGELCVNSTVPCIDSNDPLCQNKTNVDNTTTVNLPCFTNMTLEAGTAQANVPLPVSENNKFCVTSMAVPDPSKPNVEEGKTPNVTIDNTSLNSDNMTNQTEVTQMNGPSFEPMNMTNPGYGPIFYPPPMYYPPYYPYYHFYPPPPTNNLTNITINSEKSEINTTDVTPMNETDIQHVNSSNPVSLSNIENSTEPSAL